MKIESDLLKTIMVAVLLPSAMACNDSNAQRKVKHDEKKPQTDSIHSKTRPDIVLRDTILVDSIGGPESDPYYCPPCGRG